MIEAEKIKIRLDRDYMHVKTFDTGIIDEPVFFACNYDDSTFLIVSVYLDSEIGGHFTLDDVSDMEHVHINFDLEEALDLRNGIIDKINNGEASVVMYESDDIKPKVLH